MVCNHLSASIERSLSVVIPAFNEEKMIKNSIVLLDSSLKKFVSDYEIIVINDGSIDATAQILSRLTREVKSVKYLCNRSNLGLGAALRRGLKEASKELVLYMDADMPVNYSEICRAMLVLEDNDADAVLGVRRKKVYDSSARFFVSLGYNWLVRTIFAIRLRDVNFAFKLFKREALDSLSLKSMGSFISAEIVVKALYAGYRIKKIEVEYFPRKERRSRLFNLRSSLLIVLEMIKNFSDVVRFKK